MKFRDVRDIFFLWSILSAAVFPAVAPTSSRADNSAAGSTLDRVTGEFTATVVASGLDAPAGLALNPVTKEIYVAEASDISVIRGGKAVSVIPNNWRVVRDMAPWLVTDERPLDFWTSTDLQRPEALAFSQDGRMYMSENVPAGRVLEFTPNAKGEFPSARIVAVPWLQYNYTWKSISVAADGRLMLAGITEDMPGAPAYGSVIMRDADQDWWAVDYGPFARFTSVAFARNDDFLMVGDEQSDTVVWWDTIRHLAIGATAKQANKVKSVGVFPDGSIAALEEFAGEKPQDRTAQIVRIDPQSGQSRVMAQGLGAVNSVMVSKDDGAVYVTEQNAGLLLKLQPKSAFLTNNYLLQRSVTAYEAKSGLAPLAWPSYLQNFVRKLDVKPESQKEAVQKAKRANASSEKSKDGEEPALTPESFGVKVPFIAGMMKSDPATVDASSPDPIRQVDFIVFFPANALKKGDFSTPSLSLFAARHQSGRLERSIKVPAMGKAQKNADGTWVEAADKSTLLVPMATCAATPTDDGVDVNISFLGLDYMEDFYMQFKLGKDSEGRLIVNGTNNKQQSMVKYNMKLTEMDEETGTEIPTVVMSGFNKRKDEPYTWLKVGTEPQEYFLQVEEKPTWTSRWMSEVAPDLNVMLQKKEKELRAAMRKAAQQAISTIAAAQEPDHARMPTSQRVKAMSPAQPNTAMTTTDEDAAWTNMLLAKAAKIWLREDQEALAINGLHNKR